MNLIQGAQLTKGLRVSLVSGLAGIADLTESSRRYVVTDQTRKVAGMAAAPLLVDIESGSTRVASPLSVWEIHA